MTCVPLFLSISDVPSSTSLINRWHWEILVSLQLVMNKAMLRLTGARRVYLCEIDINTPRAIKKTENIVSNITSKNSNLGRGVSDKSLKT